MEVCSEMSETVNIYSLHIGVQLQHLSMKIRDNIFNLKIVDRFKLLIRGDDELRSDNLYQ